MSYNHVGVWQGRRKDAPDKVKGALKYGDDFGKADCASAMKPAYMAVKRSPFANGAVNVDVKDLSLNQDGESPWIAGVLGVITPQDIVSLGLDRIVLGTPIPYSDPPKFLKDGTPYSYPVEALAEFYPLGSSQLNMIVKPVLPLPGTGVVFAGEELVAVAAEDPYIAEEALSQITVTQVSPQPVFLDAGKIYDNEIGTHPPHTTAAYETPNPLYNKTGRAFYHKTLVKPDNSFASPPTSGTILEGTYTTEHIQHNNILPWSALVDYVNDPNDPQKSRIYVYTDSQDIHRTKETLVYMQDLIRNRLGGASVGKTIPKVISYSGGGGFGDKSGNLTKGRYIILAALLSRQIGRPVKFRASREDNLVQGGHRWKAEFRLKTWYEYGIPPTTDSTSILGLDATVIADVGPFPPSPTMISATYNASELFRLYQLGNGRAECCDVITNGPPSGPLRCVGDPVACWALETHVDRMATMQNIDPIDFRLNLNTPTSDWQKIQRVLPPKDWFYPPILSLGPNSDALHQCLIKAKTDSGWASNRKVPPSNPTSLKGQKVGWGVAGHCCSHGSGAMESTAKVTLNANSTASVWVDAMSLGQGRREQLAIIVAEKLGLRPEDVTVENTDTSNTVAAGATVGSRQTRAAGNACVIACDKIIVDKNANVPYPITEQAKWSDYGGQYGKILAYAAHVAKVTVDTDTGIVQVNNVYAVHNIGKVIFKDGCEGQVHGGIIQGIGMALQEEIRADMGNGHFYTASHLDHKMPVFTQVPAINVSYIENPISEPDASGEHNPNFGSMGIAEPTTSPIVPAVTNAIANAIGSYVMSLPVTPDKILKALGRA
jgi:xanthine dehydrogenase YagR molybdenum-binding subunit